MGPPLEGLSKYPSRFTTFNITVNGVYPGKYVVGRFDKIQMEPKGMGPPIGKL